MKITRHYYDVNCRRNYDGITNWCWVLFIDDYAWDSYDTEDEAWAAAERYDAEKAALAAEDEEARQETPWQTQDRERNQ